MAHGLYGAGSNATVVGQALVLTTEWVELKVTLPAAQYTAATVPGTLFLLAAGRVAAVVWVDSVVVTDLNCDGKAAKARAAYDVVEVSTEYPSYWSFIDGGSSSKLSQREDVTANLKSYVERAMNQWAEPDSHGRGQDSHRQKFEKFRVLSIALVQTPHLWKRYAAHRESAEDETGQLEFPDAADVEKLAEEQSTKKLMTTQIPKTSKFKPPGRFRSTLAKKSNEYYLFHGSTPSLNDIIAEQGFDPRVSKAGLLGHGTYFAETASKADQYVPPSSKGGSLVMFLARVTLGSPHITNSVMTNLTRPPDIDGNQISKLPRPRCHSVIFDEAYSNVTLGSRHKYAFVSILEFLWL